MNIEVGQKYRNNQDAELIIAEEHGVGCRFTVGQLEELSRDYGRDAYSVNNPYGRGES